MYQKWVVSARCSAFSQSMPLIFVINVHYTKQLFIFSLFLLSLLCIFFLYVPPVIIRNVLAFQFMLFIHISPSPSWQFITLTLYYIITFFPPAPFSLNVAFTNVCINSMFIMIFCKFSFFFRIGVRAVSPNEFLSCAMRATCFRQSVILDARHCRAPVHRL